MLAQVDGMIFDAKLQPQKGHPKPIEIIDQQNQIYQTNPGSDPPSRANIIGNQFKILTPTNNINVRGNLIP